MEYKPIEGYPDYEVTSDGNVISCKFGKRKKLKARATKAGYLYVNLLKNGKQTSQYVSRLVVIAFIGPIGNKTVNHKDGNKSHNFKDNLEILTQTENMEHAFTNKLHPIPKKAVKQITQNGTIVKVYESQNEAMRKTGILQGAISRVVRGVSKQAGGFIWKIA